jgi:acyl-CoA thioesterase FadM
MRTIEDHTVRFGELAGPLLHGTRFFDYQMVSTQVVTAAAGHPFPEIVAADGIPYAPVDLRTSVYRYPTFGDRVDVEVTPSRVGDSSLELVYEVTDGAGRPVSTGRMTHVTIAPEGGGLELPEGARTFYEDRRADLDPDVGPDDARDGAAGLPTFGTDVRIRSPYIEGAELAYFEEYPRFAGIALEEHLEAEGTSLAALRGDKQPFRLREWAWQFERPVPVESDLTVECDVLAVEDDTLRVLHTFTIDGTPHIRGTTEYGCFDRAGEPVPFDDDALDPFRA